MTWAVDEADLIEPHRLAPSVIDDLIIEDSRPMRREERPRRLTIRELRIAIEHEVRFVVVAAENTAEGRVLSGADLDRLWLAAESIAWIWDRGLS